MNEKYPLKSFLTAGDLKKLLANVADDCIITARDRDCIDLDQVHAVNIPEIESLKFLRKYNGDPIDKDGIQTIGEVYGGDDAKLTNI